MDPKEWQQIQTIFDKALALEPEHRAAFLARSAERQPEIMPQVLGLLETHEEAGDFLETPFFERLNEKAAQWELLLDRDLRELPNYHIKRTLGEGGMGRVYLAEQTEPLRKVALKVVKTGLENREILGRFRAEYENLARLEHSHVARIYEAGTTGLGLPYFTMEYFPGLAVTDFCRHHQLTIRQRVRLFLQICDGALHAHQRGIIHRDLKPSNILVTKNGDQPLAKIIDFGIAKAIHGDTTDPSHFETGVEGVRGTPIYMSPEQADRRSPDIRTDIYSLGAVLYQLLCGDPPFDPRRFATMPLMEMLRVLNEEMPPPPSIRLKNPAAAEDPGGDDPAMRERTARQVRGDLDQIVLKALAKDREARYATVAQLAEDLTRFLENRPVLARRGNRAYLFKKFVHRHKTAVFATLAVMAAMICGTILAVRGAVQAGRARDVALAAQETTQATARKQRRTLTYLEEILGAPDPRGRGRDIKVREILETAGQRLENEFDDEPEITAELSHILGRSHFALGDLEAAEFHFSHAYQLRSQGSALNREPALESLQKLAETRAARGHVAGAAALYRLVMQQSCLEPLQQRAQRGLADMLTRQGNRGAAIDLFIDLLRDQRGRDGPSHPNTLITMKGLANAYYGQGDFDKAEALFDAVWKARRERLGTKHADTLAIANNLANIAFERGRLAEAEAVFQQIFLVQQKVQGENHPKTLDTLHGLCRCLYALGRLEEAEQSCGRVYRLRIAAIGSSHGDSLRSGAIWALALRGTGRQRQAIQVLSDILDIQREELGAAHPDSLATANKLANTYMERGDYPQAEDLLEETLFLYGLNRDASIRDITVAQCTLAELYLAVDQPNCALPLFAQNHQTAVARFSTSDPLRYLYQAFYGHGLSETGRWNLAEPHLLEGYAFLQKIDSPMIARVHGWLTTYLESRPQNR